MKKKHDEPIGEGATTLDYLKTRYGFLGELIDSAAAELKRLRAENEQLRAGTERCKLCESEIKTLRAELSQTQKDRRAEHDLRAKLNRENCDLRERIADLTHDYPTI